MQYLELALRAATPSDKEFFPWIFEGDDWTVEEQDAVIAALRNAGVPYGGGRKYTPLVDSMYNTWRIWRFQYETYTVFTASRATWDMVWRRDSLEEFVAMLAANVTG